MYYGSVLNFDVLSLNLFSPPVMAFALGVLAALINSDLRFPPQITTYLSAYLLLAIGIKGGVALRTAPTDGSLQVVAGAIALGAILPLITFYAARYFMKQNVEDSASLAAHYGSVSAVTFTAAMGFAASVGYEPDALLPALVAILEVPGIVVALFLYQRWAGDSSNLSHALREVISGKSVVLLVGGIIMGRFASDAGIEAVSPFFVVLFPGLLTLFLLDLGAAAGRKIHDVIGAGWRMVTWGIVGSAAFGLLGVAVGSFVGLNPGGAAVLGAMAASASYIAAPAAVAVGIPRAKKEVALACAVGVTFPFNLAVGIPLYLEIAKVLA